MILVRKVPSTSHWMNYGCFTPNIAMLNGKTDAEQEEYLELVKNIFPNVAGALPWVRGSRYGIEVTTSTPDWNTNLTRYWPNMYYRPAVADFMTGRYVVFEPILWVRQNASTPIMCTPNAGPDYFGRNSSGTQTVADVDNTWRRDIRLNLDRLMESDVGSTGGEPYVTRAKYTNYRNLMVLGPNEIDVWNNARLYYLADGEVEPAPTGPPIFDDYNIDALVSGNFLSRLMQEGDPGYMVGWNGAGATITYQDDNTVSEGDGLRITFGSYSGSYAIQAGGAIWLDGTTSSTVTTSAYMRAIGASSLTSVRLQLDWGLNTGVGAAADVGAQVLNVSVPSDAIRSRDYGTVGNGIANDTTALQNAENAATGKTLYIEPGTYLITGLTINGPTRVLGYNATLKASGSTGDFLSLPVPSIVEGLTLDGNGTTKAGIKVTSTGVGGVTLLNCTIKNIIHNQNDAAINIWSANYFTVNHCTIQDSGMNALDVIFSNNGAITNNKITNSGRHGITCWGGDASDADITYGVADMVINGNYVENAVGGIWTADSTRITANYNTIMTCGDVGLDFEGGDYCSGSYNYIKNATNGGMTTFHRAHHITFDHNVVVQDAGMDAGYKSYGVGTSTFVNVTNNTITTDGSYGAMIPGYGPLTNSTFTGNDIILKGGSSAFYIETAEPTNTYSNNTTYVGSQPAQSSSQSFTVSNSAMTQYSFTANRPSTATSANLLIMRNAIGGVLDVDFVCVRASSTLPTPSATSQARTGGWTKVFDDDFGTFNTANWSKAVAGGWVDTYGDIAGWDDSLVTIANSRVRMTAQYVNGQWKSGLIMSKDKKSYTYGYFEAHIKLTPAQGAFPAWWMMPNNPLYGGWPMCGEIDILEAIGANEKTSAFGTMIFSESNNRALLSAIARGTTDFTLDFHTYGLLWEKSTDNRVILRWFIDNIPYGMYDQSQWPAAPGGPAGSPFDYPYHMIINLAMGGDWAGAAPASASGAFIEVDWVRVWQRT